MDAFEINLKKYILVKSEVIAIIRAPNNVKSSFHWREKS